MSATRPFQLITVLVLCAVPLAAHVSPVVIMRKQADVITATLPGATQFKVTTITVGKPQLRQIAQRAGYTLHTSSVRFYSGLTGEGSPVGTVVFTQVDTQHGPIEVGVAVSPARSIMSVQVTRTTAEMKPWVIDVERSGTLGALAGMRADDPPVRLSAKSGLRGMTGYIADTIATAARRALVLQVVLTPA